MKLQFVVWDSKSILFQNSPDLGPSNDNFGTCTLGMVGTEVSTTVGGGGGGGRSGGASVG